MPTLQNWAQFSNFNSLIHFKAKVKVTLRLTVSQSGNLGVESHLGLGLMTRYLLLFGSYGFVFVERPV
jgi:hypothetical protein